MKYPKPVMNKSELVKMGFSEPFLERAFHKRGQTFAWKSGNTKQSQVLFDTEEFEKYRLALCGTGR